MWPGYPRRRAIGSFLFDLVEALLQAVPRESGALDAHLELDDALKRLQVTEPHVLEVGLQVLAVALALELRLVDGHQCLERLDQLACVRDREALHRRGHHRRRRLTDRTALPRDLEVGDRTVV